MEIEESIARFAKAAPIITDREAVDLALALDRIVAENIYAPMSVPPFAKSAMDGYAVKAVDTMGASIATPVKLKVVGKIYAGDNDDYSYEPGTCVRIMTGAPIPTGFDAVVKQEYTDYGNEICQVYRSVEPYENYCAKGEDIAEQQLLASAGTILEPIHLGVFASCGIAQVVVKRKLKVAILCTGSEIVPVGRTLEYGKIYNNIGLMLQGSLIKQGLEVVALEVCADELQLLKTKLIDLASKADVVITTGGVSVGERDLLPDVLAELAAEPIFARANIQPGTPTQGWLLNRVPVLCLSGNPYAAYANFELYFWEAVASMLACAELKVEQGTAILKKAITKPIKHRRLLRAYAKDGYVEVPESSHAASSISDLVRCNCFVDVKPENALEVGSKVRIRFFNIGA